MYICMCIYIYVCIYIYIYVCVYSGVTSVSVFLLELLFGDKDFRRTGQ
jgi:hypothetical protein